MARRKASLVLDALLLLTMAVAMALVFFYAPIESEMGIVQKIFYVHVPLAWNAFLGFAMVFFSSFRYLAHARSQVGRAREAAAEVGVLFTTLVLITGPIWAKPVWGIWWTWDARLTLDAGAVADLHGLLDAAPLRRIARPARGSGRGGGCHRIHRRSAGVLRDSMVAHPAPATRDRRRRRVRPGSAHGDHPVGVRGGVHLVVLRHCTAGD